VRDESLKRKIDSLLEEPIDLFVKPEDSGTDFDIWSKSKQLAPYSFLNPKVLEQNLAGQAPAPTYLTYCQIKPSLSCKKEDMLDGLLIQEKGGLKCINERILEKQKGIVKSVIS